MLAKIAKCASFLPSFFRAIAGPNTAKAGIKKPSAAKTSATVKLDAAAQTRSTNLNKIDEIISLNMIIRLNKTVKTSSAIAAAEFVLVYRFEIFLFFCLHFAKTLTIVLWLRKAGNKCLKPDIMLKIKLEMR